MDWPMYRRVERQATRMHEMMERLGVDALALARLRKGEAYAEARKGCLFCPTTEECFAWLDATGEPEQGPDFCPNRKLLLSCRRRDVAS